MWAKFKEGFLEAVSLEGVVNIIVALVVVHILAWFFSEPVDHVAGWAALGIAATASGRK
jgi:hypothetical protein